MIRHAGEEKLEKRLAATPKPVQNMAKLFPPGTAIDLRPDGLKSAGSLYVIGYRMPCYVLLTDIDPAIKGSLRNAKKRAKPYKFTDLVPCGKDPEPDTPKIIMPED